jgi:hypothetical protein
MSTSVGRRICFGLADAAPPLSPAGHLRLGDTQSEALSELLQVFACGEESASLAFTRLGASPLEEAACRGLMSIAREELFHERLLRSLRLALPPPVRDNELRRAMLRFFVGIAQADLGLHLASIASLDSAVCLILAALLAPDCVLAQEPTVVGMFRRIHRDEAGHVRTSRRMAVALAPRHGIGLITERTRFGLVDVLARRGASFERLGIDAERLFLRLGQVPDGLFP